MRCAHLGEVSSLSNSFPVDGYVDSRFRGVKEAFSDNFESYGELGASLCVMVGGEVVVDLVGGWTDTGRMQPWLPHTLVNSFSVGKGILSILLALALSESRVSPEASVGSIWPEMSHSSVGALSLREIAGHRAGLPAVSAELSPTDVYNWNHMVQALVEQEPWWNPGTAHGYHVNTFGFLIGEILCRIRGQSHTQLLDPLRDYITDQMYWGVPMSQHERVATLYWNRDTASSSTSTAQIVPSMLSLTYNNPSNFSGAGAVNSPAWRNCVHPSTNLHATAKGVARAYEVLRSCAHPVDVSVLECATTTVSLGSDVILGSDTHFGMGFQLPTAHRRFGPNNAAYGHYGAGGSMGFCDPTADITVGYVMNQMGAGWQNSRNQSLIKAIFSSL